MDGNQEVEEDIFNSTATESTRGNIKENRLAEWLLLFLLRLQAKHYLPDATVSALLKFLYTFFCVMGGFSNVALDIARVWPQNVYAMRKALGCSDSFQVFVVCPACHKTYKFEDCVTVCGSKKDSKRCKYVQYPNHPRTSGRAPCNTPLLRSVALQNGKTLLYPFKSYCYRSLIVSLQSLLLRPGFLDACQQWRNQTTDLDKLSDLYGGKIWKEFLNYGGEPFLALPTGIAFMLNIDWFQPYTHTVYSVGVIYLVIMNLPRTVRFKRQNVIVVGIIGPTEPDHDELNNYLEPLVTELSGS